MANLKYQTYYTVHDKRIVKKKLTIARRIVKRFTIQALSTRPTTRYVTNELSRSFDNCQTNCKTFYNSFINASLEYQTYYNFLYTRNTGIIIVPYRYHTYIHHGVHSMGGVSTNITTCRYIYVHP